MELQAYRQRLTEAAHRIGVPQRRVSAAADLHAERVDGVALMKPNPIMAEIRRTRDAFAHRHGNDFDKIVDAVMASQSERL